MKLHPNELPIAMQLVLSLKSRRVSTHQEDPSLSFTLVPGCEYRSSLLLLMSAVFRPPRYGAQVLQEQKNLTTVT